MDGRLLSLAPNRECSGVPRLAGPDPALPALTLLQQAEAAGLTRDQVRHRVRSSRWQRIARGAYVTARPATDLDDFARARIVHVQRAVAAATRNSGTVVGYASAALLHALPLLGPVPLDVTLVVPPEHWTGRRSGIIFRRLLAEIGEVLESVGAMPGLARAERALQLLDGTRETVLESASYAYFVEQRLPRPRMQVTIDDDQGLVGRVDFLWDELPSGRRVVGESDGAVKYATQGEAYREKLREDRLRAKGYEVVVRVVLGPLRVLVLRRRVRAGQNVGVPLRHRITDRRADIGVLLDELRHAR